MLHRVHYPKASIRMISRQYDDLNWMFIAIDRIQIEQTFNEWKCGTRIWDFTAMLSLISTKLINSKLKIEIVFSGKVK